MTKQSPHKGDYNFWREHSIAYYKSEDSLKSYCAKQNLNHRQLEYYWKRLRDEVKIEVDGEPNNTTLPDFAKITLNEAASRQP